MASNRITVRLDQLGEIVGGATPSTNNPEYWGGDIPWLSPKDLTGYKYRYISRGEKNITEEGFSSCSTKLLPEGSVLFSSRAPIGYCAIAANSVCTNQGFKSIVPKEGVDSEFLYYLLCANRDSIAGAGSGTTFPEVSGKTMRRFEVVIPECSNDQKAIARVLGTLDAKIELNNQINDYLAELQQTIYAEWTSDGEMVTIGEIASVIDCLHSKKPERQNEGKPLIQLNNIANDGILNMQDAFWISESDYEK